MDKNYNELLNIARDVRKNSYSPYSQFSVGAALLCSNGSIYKGCNVENAAYGPTCCAERVAIFSAVADGHRDFLAVAIVGNNAPCVPCGVCRQVISEFCDVDFEIILEDGNEAVHRYTLDELLPNRFKL